MILKEKTSNSPTDKFGQAGYQAEKQMAFYLRRAFGEARDAYVFNDLRFIRNDEVAQIDHLVLHRFGIVLIESKSVTGIIEVNRQLEFVRTFGRKRTGMKSPITQVVTQTQLLQLLLNDHKEQLRRKVMMGLVQAFFSDERFKTFVAVSDQGEIKRVGCDPPELVKADRVASEIQQLIGRHTRASGFGGVMRQMVADRTTAKKLEGDQLMAFTDEELSNICHFLLRQHVEIALVVEPPPIISATPTRKVVPPPRPEPPPAPPPMSPASHTCRHCNSRDLEIVYGQYGYYFKCRSCVKNTPIDFKCAGCGAKARISKKGNAFKRLCSACGSETDFFTNPD